MAQLTDGSSFRNSRVLLFHHSVIVLLLMQPTAGQPKVDKPCQSVLATIGYDAILPCQLEPSTNVSSMTLEWTRAGPNPTFVHVWRDSEDALADQNPDYKGRTSLSAEKLENGDFSLKISGLQLSDNGTYRCYAPDLDRETLTCLVLSGKASVSPAVWKIVLIVVGAIVTALISFATGREVDFGSCVEMIMEI